MTTPSPSPATATKVSPSPTKNDYDALLTDFQLPSQDGLNIVRKLHEEKPHLPVILMTAHHSTDVAIQATRRGAWDYLMKPFSLKAMLDLIARAVEASRLAARPVELDREVAEGDSIIGRSPGMQEVYKEIGRAAGKPLTVLIRGETGTGKELVARALIAFQRAAAEALRHRQLRRHPRGRCSRANSSATKKAPSPGPTRAASAASSRPIRARFSSTKSANSP